MTYQLIKNEAPSSGVKLFSPAIVIPAFNEQETIREVIAEVQGACSYPIYVVDDASRDSTRIVARESGAVVLPLVNQLGAWGATQAGLRFALAKGHDAVVTMDADGQHDPAYIEQLLRPLNEGLSDVCIGSWPERGSKMRTIAWKLLRAASGMKIEDLTSGFRAYNTRALHLLSGWKATYLEFQDVGVLALLLQSGAQIMDTKTPMRDRQSGHSRIFQTWRIVIYYMFHSLLLGLTKRPVKRYVPNRLSVMEPTP